jgi:hypothetical protein
MGKGNDGDFNNVEVLDYIRGQEGNRAMPAKLQQVGSQSMFEVAEFDSAKMHNSIGIISELYESIGEKYGVDIKFDISSVSENFRSILAPQNRKLFSLYISEGYEAFRLTILQRIMVAISTLVDKITEDQFINSDNIELSIGMLDKLFDYMERVNVIWDTVKIENSDLMLKQVAKDMNAGEGDKANKALDDSDVQDVLEALRETEITEIDGQAD